jgi:hypothetical protein
MKTLLQARGGLTDGHRIVLDRHPIDLEVSPMLGGYSSLLGRKLMGRLASSDEKEAKVFPSTSNLLRERE